MKPTTTSGTIEGLICRCRTRCWLCFSSFVRQWKNTN